MHRECVWGRGPAGEEVEPFRGAGAGFGGVREHRQPAVGGEVEPFDVQSQLADEGMHQALGAGVVEAHVVRRPPGPEFLAAHREFADQFRESAITAIGSRGVAHDRDGLVRHTLPIWIKSPRGGVQEQVPGGVHRPVDPGVERGPERLAELVGRDDVVGSVADKGGRAGDRVQHPLHVGPNLLSRPATPACHCGWLAGTGEVKEVRAFSVVELQCAGESFEHVVGYAREVASLDAGVVLHADAAQGGKRGTPQTRHAPRAVGSDPGLSRGDPPPARGQKLPDLGLELHEIEGNPQIPSGGRPCENPSQQGLPASREQCLARLMNKSRTWFITGASRGLGVELAKAALAAGHNVIAAGRNTETVTKAIGAHDNLLVVRLDITDAEQANAAVAAAVDRFGQIDVLVNNAGNFIAGFFEEISPAQVQAQVGTLLFGTMTVTRAVLPTMRAQRAGTIVSISSTAGIVGQQFCSAYAAAKFGIEGWIESLATEVDQFGINTTIVEPGFFRTDLLTPESTTWAELSIDDYAEQSAATKAAWQSMNGKQARDRLGRQDTGAILRRGPDNRTRP